MLQIFNKLLQETDNRAAIFIRYEEIPLLEQWNEFLNMDLHRCIILKKNAATFVIIVYTSRVILELLLVYDDERNCFKTQDVRSLGSIEKTSFEIDKVKYIDRSFELAIKPEGWKYKNIQSVLATSNLHDEIDQLDSYDVVMEELRRQEEIRLREEKENKSAEQQLNVWTKYIKKERQLLDDANKPFALAGSKPEVKKSLVDIETVPFITTQADSTMLEEISSIIGGEVNGKFLEMSLEEFGKWQKDENHALDAKISGFLTLRMKVKCNGHRDAKGFKEENNYGREFYFGRYDTDTSSIELSYRTSDLSKLYNYFDLVNNSFHFQGRVSPSEAKVSFLLQVTITESEEERRKRIEILSGRDFYSKPNMQGIYLGTLSKNGSDKKHLRIILPKDKEEKQAAKDFFSQHIKGLIYPGLLKDRVLLTREFDALNKLQTPQQLQNKQLKEFIFNSSRARATEDFIGLDKKAFESTPQYLDCQNTHMLSLNPSQQEAVVKGLYAKDLCLLQGPPGTGKTTVISELIWQHIRKNQHVRIMLTSQTNLAIDNALNRLFSNSAVIEGSAAWRNMMLIKPVRKADSEKIEEEGLPFSKERIEDWVNGEDDLKSENNIVSRWMRHIAQRVEVSDDFSDILNEWKSDLNAPTLDMRKLFASQYNKDSNVLCMTCGKVDSADFNNYENNIGFDVVIVDEASKATLPELLMPLCYARKSIIIGDHRQLPPVIFEDDFFAKIREIDPDLEAELDNQFKHDLVDESLFKRLITHPFLSNSIKATFNIQYRMHPEINEIISQFYDSDSGGLKCGLDPAKVDTPNFAEKDSRFHGLSLAHFIQPNVHTIWVDVPDGMEQGEGNSTFNEKEVECVALVLEALSMANGFDKYMNYWAECKNMETRITESKIGVISFYAAQVQKIKNSIQSYCDCHNIKIAVKSVDKFQGQESGIVIVSTVRTKKLGFTRTPERLNVALSRARRLLIIIGNSDFYSSDHAKTEDGQYIYRSVIDKIKTDNNDIFIDYRELKTLLGYSNE